KKSSLGGAGNLTADGDEQVHVGWGELPRRAATDDQSTNDAVLGPQNYDIGGYDLLLAHDVAEALRQRKALNRKERGVHRFQVLQKFRLQLGRWKVPRIFRAVADG